MFGDDKHDSWKWMPMILLVGAVVFMFFDPFGMESTEIKYAMGVSQPAATVIPPQQNPPQQNPPGQNPLLQNPPAVNGDFPSAFNTGPQTAPTNVWPVSGNGTWITVSENADGYIFNGCVKTGRPGIRITNSEIRGNCATAQLWDEGGGGVFEYNNIFDVGGGGAAASECGGNSRFFRNNMKGGADGVKASSNCQVIENYIHDLGEYLTNTGGTHNDGVQIESGGTTGVVVQKNTFENTCGKSKIAGQGCAGAIFINNGASGNTVDGNYIKRWDGPTAGFIFHTVRGGNNVISNNVVECANITGLGVTSGGGTQSNNTVCP